MSKKLMGFLFVMQVFFVQAQSKYQQDFNFFWETINIEYAYFDAKQTNWKNVKEVYKKKLASIKEDWEFTYLIELMKHELYDPHFTLNRNLAFSFRLIPNDLDAHITVKNNKYYIDDIRQDYKITESILKIGDEILKVNGEDLEVILKRNYPESIKNPNDEVKEYFANLIFTGRHNEPRNITVRQNGNIKTVALEKATAIVKSNKLLEFTTLKNNIGYIKINNSLGNNNVIKQFPKAVDQLQNTKAIIIDLRNTHSGGNTDVAKAIMGKFIQKEIPYQIHERVGLEREFGIKRKYIEILSPLKKPYLKPVYVLVSRWTGSVGEAIGQGFSNISTATVVGTKMAQLLGAINCRTLQNSKLRYCYPFEKLYSTSEIPREDFKPQIQTKNYKETYLKVMQIIHGQKR
ncbi:S41 family peptidase [Polaribacter septentrionalilitoris]|uniref:S41 family peptidase n=1 Tax=Polaribacter septentrionalilitoris TaxID=2494657 RepID=UPI00135C7DAD|nr:S41 family peptidase [Polaribacter septentrionalilitoris]